MQKMIDEIGAALRADLRFLAVYATLGLPDVCASMESDSGRATDAQYKAWWNKWVLPKYHDLYDGHSLTGEDVYRLRCVAYHQGGLQMHGNYPHWDRVVFSYAGPTIHKITSTHNAGDRPTLILDPGTFCKDVCEAMAAWSVEAIHTPNYKANWSKTWRYRENGLKHHIHGAPVIA